MERILRKENQYKTFLEIINHLENQGLPDLLIIDLDGVLTETSLKNFFFGIRYLLNEKKFKNYIEKHKIPFSYLRKLAELAKKTQVVILTNRFFWRREDALKNVFPFISPRLIEKFRKKFGIEIVAQAFKPQINSRIKEIISHGKQIAYIGSGNLDRITAQKLREINSNIAYFQVGGDSLF